MPPTVSVAAFVSGLVLLVAALIGNGLKIERVELPALSSWRRAVIGVLGVGLTLFGLFDGQLPRNGMVPRAAEAGGTAPIAIADTAGGGRSTPVTAGVTSGGDSVLPCLADVAEADLIVLPMETTRRTDRKWGQGQPRAGVMAMQFTDAGGVRGGVKFRTVASAAGIDILSVVDAACRPVTTYSNVSRPGQLKDAPYNYDTMRYQYGDIVFTADISYGEGNGRLQVRAQQLAP